MALVYQCAEITRIARGRGTERPKSAHASVYLLGRTACIGLPCPMNAAGIRVVMSCSGRQEVANTTSWSWTSSGSRKFSDQPQPCSEIGL